MTRKIVNLTQHPATPAQREAGVVEPSRRVKERIQAMLTFFDLPDAETIRLHAKALVKITTELGYSKVMIGGAPFLMSTLERLLKTAGVTPLYAFSKRESVEEPLPEGGVKKTQVFKHLGFVEV